MSKVSANQLLFADSWKFRERALRFGPALTLTQNFCPLAPASSGKKTKARLKIKLDQSDYNINRSAMLSVAHEIAGGVCFVLQ